MSDIGINMLFADAPHRPRVVTCIITNYCCMSMKVFNGGSAGHTGWDGASAQLQQEPLGAPPDPLQYRVLSTVIADQLQAIAKAEIKRLGEALCCGGLQPISTASLQTMESYNGRAVCETLCPVVSN